MRGNEKERKFIINYNIEEVYNAILEAAANVSKFRVTNANKVTHAITISVSMSLFSWGGTNDCITKRYR